jgi:hypothetical protein
MTNPKIEYKKKLLKAIDIQNTIVEDSQSLEIKTKEAFINLGNYWKDRIEKEQFTITSLKSITNDILTFWKESVSIDTELFWTILQKNNIDFERKDELIFALNKGRFRRVDIGMAARKDWSKMRNFNSIVERFSQAEIENIDKIIEEDENKRLEILTRCLKKSEIPQTQYLKFGECMAYFSFCNLFDKYFSKKEVEKLNEIWRDFKSK